MTAFVSEEYYKNEYLCGKEAVIDTAFDFYARQATAEIKRYIERNLTDAEIPDCVKMCCCELAELNYKHEKTTTDTNGKTSESVGGWSVSYESAEESKKNYDKAVKACIYKWLSGTGLLYRGLK